MREIYNEDLSPETPEAKQDFFHCLAACSPNQNYFNFINLIPSRSVAMQNWSCDFVTMTACVQSHSPDFNSDVFSELCIIFNPSVFCLYFFICVYFLLIVYTRWYYFFSSCIFFVTHLFSELESLLRFVWSQKHISIISLISDSSNYLRLYNYLTGLIGSIVWHFFCFSNFEINVLLLVKNIHSRHHYKTLMPCISEYENTICRQFNVLLNSNWTDLTSLPTHYTENWQSRKAIADTYSKVSWKSYSF